MFNNAEKKAIKERIKGLNKEFDQVVMSYEMSMEQGDAMLEFMMNRWKKELDSKKEG